MTEFKNRVFGCVVVKAINSNYIKCIYNRLLLNIL